MKLKHITLVALLFAGLPLASFGQVGVSINIAPPVLPVIEQPPCPVEGYLWTPGYWGYSDVGYYWVPGAWVEPPQVGLLWTPPYWGYNDGAYVFNDGYWGPTVGFYGGINYGFGYFGDGYYGGRWDGNVFRYNTAVTRVNTAVIHTTYADRTVLSKQTNQTRASFNGPNGVKAEATAEQKAAASANHVPATAKQTALREAASKNRDLQASVNKGHPKAAAVESVRKTVEPAGAGKAAGAENAANKGANGANAENATRGGKKSAAEREGAVRNEENAEAGNARRNEREEANSRRAERTATHPANTHAAEGVEHRSDREARERENVRPTQRGASNAARTAHRPETAGVRQGPPSGARGQGQAQPPAEQKGKRKPAKPGEQPDGR